MTWNIELDMLPRVSDKRIAIHVKPAAERALKQGHPWLFEEAIRKQSREGKPGDFAVIFDKKERFLGVGLYDPQSHIRVKVLHHHTPLSIDENWIKQKLDAIFAIRQSLKQTDTNGYRLIHGENDGLPGLVLDRYADTLVLKLYSTVWIPHLSVLLPLLMATGDRLVLRLSRNIQDEKAALCGLYDGQTLFGTAPDVPIVFMENGLRFEADVVHGHKTGFFFDQRDNRGRVGELSAGASVLDVFAYAGGFSLYAARGGAKQVVSLDISAPALENAKRNFMLNQDIVSVANTEYEVMVADAFEVLEQFRFDKRQFDVVIIDPPAFAKRQSEVEGALRAYAKLANLGAALVKPGGHFVMASCSSRISADDFFQVVTRAVQRPLLNQQRTGHALDHPIGFAEGAYLKCLFGTIG